MYAVKLFPADKPSGSSKIYWYTIAVVDGGPKHFVKNHFVKKGLKHIPSGHCPADSLLSQSPSTEPVKTNDIGFSENFKPLQQAIHAFQHLSITRPYITEIDGMMITGEAYLTIYQEHFRITIASRQTHLHNHCFETDFWCLQLNCADLNSGSKLVVWWRKLGCRKLVCRKLTMLHLTTKMPAFGLCGRLLRETRK
jgi:hypothetical protein